jgi:aminoglycoside phosphotransferase (APT) family kinase protein
MTSTQGNAGLDTVILGRWLDGKGAPGAGEEPVADVLTGGSQNMLYLIIRGEQRMVLRMPGPRADERRVGELLREIRLVAALEGTDVPHAALIAAEETGGGAAAVSDLSVPDLGATGAAVVTKAPINSLAAFVTASTAASKAAWLACEGAL